MPASTVQVQHSDGSPARNVRVSLGLSSGVTAEAFTNEYGEAVVDHASTGQATVYVSGQAYHSFHAPGRTSVTV